MQEKGLYLKFTFKIINIVRLIFITMQICYINAARLSSCTDKAIVRGTRIGITNQWIISIVSLRA